MIFIHCRQHNKAREFGFPAQIVATPNNEKRNGRQIHFHLVVEVFVKTEGSHFVDE